MAESKIKGSCHCGGIQYEFTGKPTHMICCHCSICRQTLGADYGTFFRIPSSNFTLLKKETLKGYKTSKEATRMFCGNCGAHVVGGNAEGDVKGSDFDPDGTWICGGTLLGDPGIALHQGHVFTNYKLPWVKISDELPSCGEGGLFFDLMQKKD